MEASLRPIPPPHDEDDEDVHWALSTATALWGRGEREEALRWLRRAAEQASDANADMRALELFKAAAEVAQRIAAGEPSPSLSSTVSATVPPPIPSAPPPAPGQAARTLRSSPPGGASAEGAGRPEGASASAPPLPKAAATSRPPTGSVAPRAPAAPGRAAIPSWPAAGSGTATLSPYPASAPGRATELPAPPGATGTPTASNAAVVEATVDDAEDRPTRSMISTVTDLTTASQEDEGRISSITEVTQPAPAAPQPGPPQARRAASGWGDGEDEESTTRRHLPGPERPERYAFISRPRRSDPDEETRVLDGEDAADAGALGPATASGEPLPGSTIGAGRVSAEIGAREGLSADRSGDATLPMDPPAAAQGRGFDEAGARSRAALRGPSKGAGAAVGGDRGGASTRAARGEPLDSATWRAPAVRRGAAPIEPLPALRVAVLGTTSSGELRLALIDAKGAPPAGAALAILVPASPEDGEAIVRLLKQRG